MKLLLRLDDLGYSRGINYGMKEVVSKIATANIGLMANMPFAAHGAKLMRNSPNICLGLHVNLCMGESVTDIAKIPSLINPETNRFYSSRTVNNRDIDTMDKEECLIEIRSQLRRFIQLVGQFPEYIDVHAIQTDSVYEATKIVADEFNMTIGETIYSEWGTETGITKATVPSMDENNEYDPYDYVFNNETNINHAEIGMLIFHPGYLDKYILDHSSFNTVRPLELDFLTSEEFIKWLQQNKIELVNFKNYQI